jgi:hypothetical protein
MIIKSTFYCFLLVRVYQKDTLGNNDPYFMDPRETLDFLESIHFVSKSISSFLIITGEHLVFTDTSHLTQKS